MRAPSEAKGEKLMTLKQKRLLPWVLALFTLLVLEISVLAQHSGTVRSGQPWIGTRGLTTCAGSPEVCDPMQWHWGKPLNNQCPVCGEIVSKDEPGVAVRESRGERSLLVRCHRCNAAFWKD